MRMVFIYLLCFGYSFGSTLTLYQDSTAAIHEEKNLKNKKLEGIANTIYIDSFILHKPATKIFSYLPPTASNPTKLLKNFINKKVLYKNKKVQLLATNNSFSLIEKQDKTALWVQNTTLGFPHVPKTLLQGGGFYFPKLQPKQSIDYSYLFHGIKHQVLYTLILKNNHAKLKGRVLVTNNTDTTFNPKNILLVTGKQNLTNEQEPTPLYAAQAVQLRNSPSTKQPTKGEFYHTYNLPNPPKLLPGVQNFIWFFLADLEVKKSYICHLGNPRYAPPKQLLHPEIFLEFFHHCHCQKGYYMCMTQQHC